jgi:DNA anti-recombination protein RmuC
MNEQTIEDIISALYDMVQDARALPLGADKCILERDKVLDILDEVIAQLPTELKQARTIVESRNELVNQARREAETLIRQAQEKANQLVEQEAIYQEAKRQCREMVEQTQSRMAELRKASNDYMDDALRRTEEAIAMSLDDVRDTRAKFRTLIENQEKRASAASIDAE